MAIGGTSVASLYATLGADVSDFTKGMASAKNDMNGFQKGMSGIQSAVGTALKTAAVVGIAAIGGLAAGVAKATSAAADMEQQLANIAAVMGTSSEETAALKDLIMDLGLDPKLKVTAVEAAQAIEMLGKNGLTLDEILEGAARSTVLLANSTGADFATAADIATDVMAQFNIAAGDMDKAVNGITGVTKASKFDINDYRLAIAQAGGVASSVGVSFDDFNAVIAATSPSFASGSDAGTSFKTFLQRLVPQSKAATEQMAALGLITAEGGSAFFDASGKMKSMSEIAELLQGSFGGLSEAQAIEAAATIFGTDAMRTAFAMAKSGGETIDEMKRIIGNTSAEDAAATRMNTLRGAWEIFQGVTETLTLAIGDKFLPVARRIIEWATDMASTYGPRVIEWVGKVSSALSPFIEYLILVVTKGQLINDWLSSLPAPIESVIVGIVGFYNAVAEAIRWIGDILGQFITWQDVWTAVAVLVGTVVVGAIVSFIAAIAPVVGIIAGVVIAVAALRTAWENDFLGIRTATNTAKEYLVERFGGLGTAIKEFGGAALGEIKAWATGQDTEFTATKKIWESAKDTFGNVFSDIGNKLKEWGALAKSEFGERFPQAAETLTKAWDNIKAKWGEFWAVLKPAVDKLVETVKGMVQGWTDGTGEMGSAMQTAKGIIDGALSIIVTVVETAISVMIDTLKLVVQLLSGDWAGAWQTARGMLDTVWNGMKTIAMTALKAIADAFGVSIEDIGRIVGRLLEHGRQFVENFRQGVTEKWNAFKMWIDERFQALPQPIKDTIRNMLGWGRDIIQGLWDGVRNMWTSFTGWFRDRWSDLTNNFKSFFGIRSPSTLFQSFGMSLGQGLQAGIQSSTPGVFSAFDSFTSGILSRANALGVSLDGSLAQVAGRITALQNHMEALTRIERIGAQQIANYTMPTASTGVSSAPSAAASAPATASMAAGNVVQWAAQFAQDAANFAGSLSYDVAAQAGLVGQAYRDAYYTLTDNQPDTEAALIQAIYTLVNAIKAAPGGNQFQINMAANQTGNLQQDLNSAVQYLSALYAS